MYVDMGGAAATMQTLAFDEDVVTRVMKVLQRSAGTLEPASDIVDVPTTNFGVTQENDRLGYHSERAREYVVEAVMDMVNGLQHYAIGFRDLREHGVAADQTSETSLSSTHARLNAGANCANTTQIQEPNVCVAPTEPVTGGEG
ncbi:hypothetical protein [Nocardioides ferulae]|uniref:hypothetical protein n=1 Tax=Nocardioides ferulae TaxID=2340821 RepID=UPI000EABEBA2|nr:hypothetical protein [Nocardioides ferulae]